MALQVAYYYYATISIRFILRLVHQHVGKTIIMLLKDVVALHFIEMTHLGISYERPPRGLYLCWSASEVSSL
jgi:hypothetical protein